LSDRQPQAEAKNAFKKLKVRNIGSSLLVMLKTSIN
jgi:hypothetical protein